MCTPINYNTLYSNINKAHSNYSGTLTGIISTSESAHSDYSTNQSCWIRQLNKQFLNNPEYHKYLQTKHNILPTSKIAYQPYGTFMDFSHPVYQDSRICDLRYTPSAGFKKINNQDLFILKNKKHNNAIIKSALDDFVIVSKQD